MTAEDLTIAAGAAISIVLFVTSLMILLEGIDGQ